MFETQNTLTESQKILLESWREHLETVSSKEDLVAFVKNCDRALRMMGYLPPILSDETSE